MSSAHNLYPTISIVRDFIVLKRNTCSVRNIYSSTSVVLYPVAQHLRASTTINLHPSVFVAIYVVFRARPATVSVHVHPHAVVFKDAVALDGGVRVDHYPHSITVVIVNGIVEQRGAALRRTYAVELLVEDLVVLEHALAVFVDVYPITTVAHDLVPGNVRISPAPAGNSVAFVVMDSIPLDDGAREGVDVDAVAPVVADEVVADDGVRGRVHDLDASVPVFIELVVFYYPAPAKHGHTSFVCVVDFVVGDDRGSVLPYLHSGERCVGNVTSFYVNGSLLHVDAEPMPRLPETNIGDKSFRSRAQDSIRSISFDDNRTKRTLPSDVDGC